MAFKRLQSEYKQLLNEPNYYYSIYPNAHNFLNWDILILGPQDTIFEGAIIKCNLVFPPTYPNKPPEFRFITNLPHPNIYPDGKVCISILHDGHDIYNYEHISERWNPSHSVSSILMSIISMLSSPNFESPANIEISMMWKNDFNNYKNMIYKIVSDTQQ
jgi:ubiquitin-conjugating enzyme E2 G1